jgi:uncharacterized protein (TIGR02300 family)
MAEIKLGNKYDCFNCGTKFYDLGKGAALCPKCGADQKDAADKNNPLVAQAVRRRRRAELATPEEAEPAEEEPEIAVLEEDEDLGELGLAAEEEEEEDEDEAV